MAVDSEAIWTALTDRLTAKVEGFATITRKRRDYGIEEHPVLMILDDEGDETLIGESDDPSPRWRLTGQIIVLARADVEQDRPAAALNTLKRSVMEALERTASDPVGNGLSFYSDLGGLVQTLSVTKVEKGAGALAGQAVAKLYVEMETTPG